MMRVRIIIALLLVGLVSGTTTAVSKEKNGIYRLIFSTFDVSSAGKYAYLRNSVQSMLAGRLAAYDGVVVLDHTLSDKELSALEHGIADKKDQVKPADGDYLVTGTLFSLTSGLDVKLTLYPFSQKKNVLRFSLLVDNLDQLIPKIENLSREVAQKAFGYQISDQPQAGIAEKTGEAAFVTVNPEAAYKRGLYVGTIVTEGGVIKTVARGAKHTQKISGNISVMAVGDMDGDGKEEIAVLAGRKLKLFNLQERKIIQIAEMSLPPAISVHAINIADINGDGKKEMFVSGTTGLRVSSAILSWNPEHGLQTVLDNIRWYLRPVFLPGEGWILAGQRRGMNKIDLVRAGIFRLQLTAGNTIEKGKRLELPESVNLFDFIYADVDGDNSYERVVIDHNEKMRIYNSANELTWVSDRNFGGSKVYIGPSQGAATDEQSKTGFSLYEDEERDLIFVPARMIAADLDGDGKQEIIINEQQLSSFNFFYKLRMYDGGIVVGLAWNGSALQEVWRTGKFRGYLAGYSFSLLAKDKGDSQAGQNESSVNPGRLYVGSIPNSGTMVSFLPGMEESLLTVYDLGFSPAKMNKKVSQ